jgi:hypothetical protein
MVMSGVRDGRGKETAGLFGTEARQCRMVEGPTGGAYHLPTSDANRPNGGDADLSMRNPRRQDRDG